MIPITQMIIETTEVADKICTEWECSFLKDMTERVKEGKTNFTDKQEAVIRKLYKKACQSPY